MRNSPIELMTYQKLFWLVPLLQVSKDEIRLEVKLKRTRTLINTIGVTRLVKEKQTLQKKNTTTLKAAWTNKNTTTVGLLGPHPNPKTTSGSGTITPFRLISGQEAKERREKGLCYYCYDKYTPGHRCIKL